MSAKLGGYYADRGGMFMAADLKRMAKQKVTYVQVTESIVKPRDVDDVTQASRSAPEVIGTRIRSVATVCRLSARDIHRLAHANRTDYRG